MNKSSIFRVACALGAALLATETGCSLFFDLEDSQCHVTNDCKALGPRFANTVCTNRVCVPSLGVGGAGQGGGAAGGSGGTPPQCTTSADCVDAFQEPYLCKQGRCIQLTSVDCPVVLPRQNTLELLKTGEPVVIGAWSRLGGEDLSSLATVIWDLALSEFNGAPFHGLELEGAPRPVLAVVCDPVPGDPNQGIRHLNLDLGANAVASALPTDLLYSAFNYTRSQEYADLGGQPLLVLDGGIADLHLANLMDDGLLWSMLGDPRGTAAPTVALLKRMETYVNAQRQASFDAGTSAEDPQLVPLRVTLVYADSTPSLDLFTTLTTPDARSPEDMLVFNGMPAIDQLSGVGDGSFREVQIQSYTLHSMPDVSMALTELEAHPPHIVVALTGQEFPPVIQALEKAWGSAGQASAGLPRPYYLMSLYSYQVPGLVAAIGVPADPPAWQRLVGINYAHAQDAHSKELYAAYEARLASFYQGPILVRGAENYYDAAYSLLYAVAAAQLARSQPSGGDVRDALQDRVLGNGASAESVDIGPEPIAAGELSKFGSLTYQMSLWATLGPPDFDRTTGSRVSPTSAWCIEQNPTSHAWGYADDGLIYDPTTQQLIAPSTGVPSCLASY